MSPLSLLGPVAAILLGALVGGRLAAWCRIPRVTGYLLTGLALGPSLTVITGLPAPLAPEQLARMQLLSDLALALIMVSIGGQLRTDNLRRWRGRIAAFSFSETLLTGLMVALATGAVNLLWYRYEVPGLSLVTTSLMLALFLGVISMETAPAATLMVVREYEADGPVTCALLTLVGLNNLTCALLFTLLAHLLLGSHLDAPLLATRLFGPLLAGLLLGLATAAAAQRLEQATEFKLLVLGALALLLYTCHSARLSLLLGALAFGTTLANSCPRWNRLLKAIRQVDYPLYVCFFVLAGASLHLETLWQIGGFGAAYLLARTSGKLLGTRLGARLGQFGPRERQLMGMMMLSQAGLAIGLASQLRQLWPEGGPLVETVVLGSVVVFELLGPLLVRQGLVYAGEVPLLSLLHKRAPKAGIEGLHEVVLHFRQALGLPAGHRVADPGDILVRHVLRKNVDTIDQATPYNKLLQIIAHSRYDRFPVVNRQGDFVGMINYTEIRNLLFEPALTGLVVAGDLVSDDHLHMAPDQSLRDALALFREHRDISFFPVLDPREPQQLLGILSQNDVMAAFRSLRSRR